MSSKLISLKMVPEFAKAIDLEVEVVTQTLALKAHTGIVKRTPVDTGRARANWFVGIGAINTKTTTSTQPTEPNFSEIDGKKVVYISNSLDYIQPLEDGHSDQAPFGMAAITMAELQGEIDATL